MIFPISGQSYDVGEAKVQHIQFEDDADDAVVDKEGGQQPPYLKFIESPSHNVGKDVRENPNKNAQ